MKNLLLVFAFLTVLMPVLHAQDPAPIAPEKRQEIEKLLKTTGVEKLIPQMMGQVINMLKAQAPGIPDEFWVKFQQKVDAHELIEKMIPLYDKYYTIDDLKAINAFYETPTGQKLLSAAPQIMAESMKIGQEWGAKIGAEAEEEIKQEKAGK